jgi:hypothetical protein
MASTVARPTSDTFSRREIPVPVRAFRLGCGGSLRPAKLATVPRTPTGRAWEPHSAFASFGSQALQRCSGLLNRTARGSTVATHHFGGETRIEKSHEKFSVPRVAKDASAFRVLLRPFSCSCGSMANARRFERRRCRWAPCRERQFKRPAFCAGSDLSRSRRSMRRNRPAAGEGSRYSR